ncbi:acyltransferase family protein [Dactylosporangium sp. CS-033363]|uniref:acyltransferase family protein n=1 Tax=Dactylosporangium sp. CS-033363 TaxID=3239935 RepID=UPI003D8B4E1C
MSSGPSAERDRAVDALRAIAICGVVLGHWLVTAVVVSGDTIRVASPLRAVPWLAPASWLFQTLALFFFVGGLVATRPRPGKAGLAATGARPEVRQAGAVANRGSRDVAIGALKVADGAAGDQGGPGDQSGRSGRDDRGGRNERGGRDDRGGENGRGRQGARRGYGRWLTGRLERLFRPVLVLVAVWSGLVIAATVWTYVTAASPSVDDSASGWAGFVDHLAVAVRSHTVLKLVASPLWFLLVFAALTMARPLVARLHPGWPLAVVAAVDLGRFGLGAPAWIGWVNLAAGWLVPFCLGAAWSKGRFRARGSAWFMLLGGAGATVVLTRWFGYPVSMVGVPGQGISNLNPPTLAAVTFGIAQCGAALLLMPVLHRLMRRDRPWRMVTAVNLSAMTIFLWHQTSLLAVTLLTPAPLSGLHTAPEGPSWLFARLLWLPVFAVVLSGCWVLFRRHERRRPAGRPARDTPIDAPSDRRARNKHRGEEHCSEDHCGDDHCGDDHCGNDHCGDDHCGNDHCGDDQCGDERGSGHAKELRPLADASPGIRP